MSVFVVGFDISRVRDIYEKIKNLLLKLMEFQIGILDEKIHVKGHKLL